MIYHVIDILYSRLCMSMASTYLIYDNISVNIVSGALPMWPNSRAATDPHILKTWYMKRRIPKRKTFWGNGWFEVDKVLSSNKPCQVWTEAQHLGNPLCLHHQGMMGLWNVGNWHGLLPDRVLSSSVAVKASSLIWLEVPFLVSIIWKKRVYKEHFIMIAH
jgi:hypothetical protein